MILGFFLPGHIRTLPAGARRASGRCTLLAQRLFPRLAQGSGTVTGCSVLPTAISAIDLKWA